MKNKVLPKLDRVFKSDKYEEVFYHRYMIEGLPMEMHYAEKGFITVKYTVCLN